jgi:hypothetical protein
MWARGVEFIGLSEANGVTLLWGQRSRTYGHIMELREVETKCPRLNLDVYVARCNHAAF